MKQSINVELTEEDVLSAIREFVRRHKNLEVKEITMSTGTRGDYDKGNAVEYVRKVWCECKNNKKED